MSPQNLQESLDLSVVCRAYVGAKSHLQSPACALSIQFWLTMSYLSRMTEEQTLVMYSGHPLGLFPSSPRAPRLVITNGMVSLRQPAYSLSRAGLGTGGAVGEEAIRQQHTTHSPSLPLSQVIPNYSSRKEYEKLFALGVTM